MTKVRVGKVYTFRPVPIDYFNPPYNVQAGDVVRVVNLPGCPKANTMGHCPEGQRRYVESLWVRES